MASQDVAKGDPSKGLFVEMITKDLGPADAILDLLDNCVDGAIRTINPTTKEGRLNRDYTGFWVTIDFTSDTFDMNDNCGGIPLELAKEYAFRFGKPDDAPEPITESIGLYGIGMKRGLLKMGGKFQVTSITATDVFDVCVDVSAWRKAESWDFPMKVRKTRKADKPFGTKLKVTELYQSVQNFYATSTFLNEMYSRVQRDYSFILKRGLTITINGHKVRALIPTLKVSDELAPYRVHRRIDGVDVEVTAGLGAPPPADDSPGIKFPEKQFYGWYIVCNDRVILSADRSETTGWGRGGVANWHPQYLGFFGLVRFDCPDPTKLPWTTTKHGVDVSSTVYQKALVYMMEVTREFVAYTNKRLGREKDIKQIEKAAKSVPVWEVPRRNKLKVPAIIDDPHLRIQYNKPWTEIVALGKALRLSRISGKGVGIASFEYAYKREVRK